ncbi:MAG: type 1 glutamine amidotransferase [Bacilli bacterium]
MTERDMAERTVTLAHLFPELLNLYADQGNIAVLRRRAQARGWTLRAVPVKLGSPMDLASADMVLLGGGSDREQQIVGRELAAYREDFAAAIEAGLPVLAVCGGYQLLGRYYELQSGERVAGLGLLDVATKADKGRLIGNIAIEWTSGEGVPGARTIVGFENHAGRTYHDYAPLGRVLKGHGNNGRDHQEGLQYKGVVGTYIHGPLLPKNPHLADHLLARALAFKGCREPLCALDDALEWSAHHAVLEMLGVKS